MGEVVPFTGITCVEEPPEQVLEKAKEWGLEKVVIVGLTADNELIVGGSFSEIPLAY